MQQKFRWHSFGLLLFATVVLMLMGFAFKHVPWLAVPLWAVAFVWHLSSARARMMLRRYFESRGMTIDDFASITATERTRLGAPKGAWIIRYHDREAVEYWAMAVTRKWRFEILQDVPRQVYESGKPAWKEGDEIDVDVLKELANPSAARRYFRALTLAAFQREDRTMHVDEKQGVGAIVDSPEGTSFSSLLQVVQIACRTTQASGSAEMVVHGQGGYILEFACLGQPGCRTLALTLKPDDVCNR